MTWLSAQSRWANATTNCCRPTDGLRCRLSSLNWLSASHEANSRSSRPAPCLRTYWLADSTAAARVAKIARAIITSSKVNPRSVFIDDRLAQTITGNTQPTLGLARETQGKGAEFIAAEHHNLWLPWLIAQAQWASFLFKCHEQPFGQAIGRAEWLPAGALKAQHLIAVAIQPHAVLAALQHRAFP